ncbi:hypothetical protein PIB30_054012 [Stylosanthes scabra]|uniref:FAF domain-containing protein n=1 Tax=Stylosanthes scabra TaxID=79078 RepID=A0ABU6WJW6_9FABA|nr:hypothetical protein [Stylosanthes scabra]
MSNMIQTQTMPSFMKREEDETMVKLKQGIVTILGDNSTYIAPSSSASSLRRTLSADMSSKKWTSLPLQEEEKDYQDSFKMKKIASSEELTQHHPTNSYSSSSSSSDEEDKEEEEEEEAERERLAIWSSILKNKKEEQEKSKGGFDTWGSIMSMKSSSSNNNNHNLEMTKSLPVSVTVTPYVHPLVKRSKSSLSDKSLQICTESLGSETGSDTSLFSSSYPSPQSGESEKVVKESEPEPEQEQEENINHVAAITKSKSLSHPRCFPPPLPSLSFHGCNKNQGDSSSSSTTTSSSSLHVKPHRDNGRLVLQAVSLPSNNNFKAQRQDGRLVLTFTNDQQVPEVEEDEEVEESYDDEVMEEEEEFEEEEVFEEDDDYEEEEKEEEEDENEEANEVEVVMEKKAPLVSSGITTTTINSGGANLHRLTLMMNNNKTIGLVNRNINPNWSEKFNNKGMNLEDVNVSVVEMTKSLPQRVARLIPSSPGSTTSPPPPSSFNLNAYEYYWKTPKPSSQLPNINKNTEAIVCGGENQFSSNNNEQLLVLRGKNGDYLVHNFKGCKDSRRSLLFWEPYCVATS